MNFEKLLNSPHITSYDASCLLKDVVRVANCSSQKVYLSQDGEEVSSIPSVPVAGIFVNDTLLLSTCISEKPMSANQAQIFYQQERLRPPTLYQILLLQLNFKHIELRLKELGIKCPFSSNDILKKVWYKDMFADNSSEERYCVILHPYQDYKELLCEQICCENLDTLRQYFFLDNSMLVVHNRGYASAWPLTLLLRWNKFDFLVVDKPDIKFVFLRHFQMLDITILVVDSIDDLEILSPCVLRCGHKIYQIVNNKLVLIHNVDNLVEARFNEGGWKLLLFSEKEADNDGVKETECAYYVADDNGRYIERVSE